MKAHSSGLAKVALVATVVFITSALNKDIVFIVENFLYIQTVSTQSSSHTLPPVLSTRLLPLNFLL